MAMERFESASSEHGIPIDEARRLVRTSVDRWNEEVLREFAHRSEEHTSELQSLMRISYAVFCLKKKNTKTHKFTKNIISSTNMNNKNNNIQDSTIQSMI